MNEYAKKEVIKNEYTEKAWVDIRKLRKKYGWRQLETAEKLGISRSYLSTIENNKRGISMKMMSAIIKVFGVKYEDFYRKSN